MPIATSDGTPTRLTTTVSPAARVTLQRLASNGGSVYVGIIAGDTVNYGSGADIGSADYVLTSSVPSVTIGQGKTKGNPYDARNIWITTENPGEGVAWFIERR